MLDYEGIFYACLLVNVGATAARLLKPTTAALKEYVRSRPSKRRSRFDNNSSDCCSATVASTTTTMTTGISDTTTRMETDSHKNTSTLSMKIEPDQKQQKDYRRLLYLTYLPVYLLATMADWLQGPYKYALYSAYGYTQSDIATLFVAGFGSGMVLGSIVGGYADTMGRRKLSMGYCVAYALSVMFKHARPFGMLLMGRVMGGIATSLLYSVFDSWLIKAHASRGLTHRVSHSLSVATYGSSMVAILAGILANASVSRAGPLRPMFEHRHSAESVRAGEASMVLLDESKIFYKGGYIVPFDLTLIPLLVCGILARILWEENYGDKEGRVQEVRIMDESDPLSFGLREIGSLNDEDGCRQMSARQMEQKNLNEEITNTASSNTSNHEEIPTSRHRSSDWMRRVLGVGPLQKASRTVWDNADILSCCIISSLFEGSMYVFIFMWTPALTALEHISDDAVPNQGEKVSLPLGYIFSTFMVSCMIGTTAFSYFTHHRAIPAQNCLVYILALSAISCCAMAVSWAGSLIPYMGMLLFEASIGAYYPAMGTVKSMLVPENQRSAIYNVFRLPLNMIVLINLAMLGNLTHVQSFLLCSTMLTTATVLHSSMTRRLSALQESKEERHSI